jgi:hypothetical protein
MRTRKTENYSCFLTRSRCGLGWFGSLVAVTAKTTSTLDVFGRNPHLRFSLWSPFPSIRNTAALSMLPRMAAPW